MSRNKQRILCSAVFFLMTALCGCGKQDTAPIPPESVADAFAIVQETEVREVTSETVEETVNLTEPPAIQQPEEPQPMLYPEETQAVQSTVETHAVQSTAETQAFQNTEGTQPVQNAETIPSSTDPTDATGAAEGEAEVVQMVIPELGPRDNMKYTDFVNVQWYIPDVQVELRYAGSNNFTGETIYNYHDAYLRYGTVCKLMEVCKELAEQGLYLKIWDAFRPVSAQFKLWETFPDSRYVANPNRGFSAHSRGNALDVTLVDAYGNELPMPSEFDDFTDAANRDYKLCSEEERKNAKILEAAMEKHGFHGYWGEWWHFSDSMQYEPEHMFDPGVISVWYPKCNEFITLRKRASAWSEALNQIPLGSPMIILGYNEKFAMVEYLGQRGYVLLRYIQLEP